MAEALKALQGRQPPRGERIVTRQKTRSKCCRQEHLMPEPFLPLACCNFALNQGCQQSIPTRTAKARDLAIYAGYSAHGCQFAVLYARRVEPAGAKAAAGVGPA